MAATAVLLLLVPAVVACGNDADTDATDGATSDEIAAEGSAAEVRTATGSDSGTGDPDVTDAETSDEGGSTGSAVDTSADTSSDADATTADAAQWPRPWDPTQPIDFSGVAGVSAEQQARAEQLVENTLNELPYFADVNQVTEWGYSSIGDASTGYEHYVNLSMIDDDKLLDPTAPESLVYEVDGDNRTLVSAMFIAPTTTLDDPELTGFAGPLMEWHVHDNLCWGEGPGGRPVVKAVVDSPDAPCPAGSVNPGGLNPMVHVWIAPNECGPFAALEGDGAGQTTAADGERRDQCAHDDGHQTGSGDHTGMDMDDDMDMDTDMDMDHDSDEAAMKPYDPAKPIDLSGVDGVTLEQQAYAENLVSATIVMLPQWEDLDVVEAAGFKSIGDGLTGHEHYIQWDWIDDDVWLDPNHPESLVFEPQPDGSKKLVSAMYMLPNDMTLDEVPDWGGALMQWHIHGDLCFTDDPVAPQVAGGKSIGGTCRAPLVDGPLAPMIHVWIIPEECGPFAALEGIGGGQVPDGEAVSCLGSHDH